MFWFFQTDETDPIARSYRLYFHKLCIYGLMLLVLVTLVCVVGIPHFQTSYRFMGPAPRNGIPIVQQKVDAWYLGVTGWQHVRSGQYGHEGCPYILFVPVGDCVDLSSFETTFPFTFFAKE